MEREELVELIRREIMTTPDVLEELGISRARLNQLIQEEKLVPVIATPRLTIFLRRDVDARKAEQGELKEKFMRSRKLFGNYLLYRWEPGHFEVIRLPDWSKTGRAGAGTPVRDIRVDSWEEAEEAARAIIAEDKKAREP